MSTAVLQLDPLGRILSLDPTAERLLGVEAGSVARERLAMFVPGPVALTQLPGWLAAAAQDGCWEGDGLLRHRDGHPLPCHLRLRTRTAEGAPAGFTLESTPLQGVAPERLAPRAGPGTALARFVAITRLPFVSASVLPVVLGLAVAAWTGAPFAWIPAVLAVLATLLLHLGANTANDWFDWKGGADAVNRDAIPPFSGGSRALPMGLITERGLLLLIVGCFALGGLCGLGVVLLGNPWLLAIGAAGALLGFAYSAPPLRLVARRGLGELAIFLAFGPLLTLAGYAAGGAPLTWAAALVGLPSGLVTTAILWVNQIPDCAGDRAAGKWNLVAVLGRRRARLGLPVLLGLAHLASIALAFAGLLPWSALASLLALPLVVKGARIAWAHAEDDGIAGACAATVQHQSAFALLAFLGVLGAALLQG
jgi:1,4-dihydroxy-2-naphthoate octaprenyltransferase